MTGQSQKAKLGIIHNQSTARGMIHHVCVGTHSHTEDTAGVSLPFPHRHTPGPFSQAIRRAVIGPAVPLPFQDLSLGSAHRRPQADSLWAPLHVDTSDPENFVGILQPARGWLGCVQASRELARTSQAALSCQADRQTGMLYGRWREHTF